MYIEVLDGNAGGEGVEIGGVREELDCLGLHTHWLGLLKVCICKFTLSRYLIKQVQYKYRLRILLYSIFLPFQLHWSAMQWQGRRIHGLKLKQNKNFRSRSGN